MVPADCLHVQYSSSLAAGFWTGTGFAEGSLVGALFHSNEPLNYSFFLRIYIPPGDVDAVWMPRQTQSKPVQLMITWGGSTTHASVSTQMSRDAVLGDGTDITLVYSMIRPWLFHQTPLQKRVE